MDEERLAAFEKMLAAVQAQYNGILESMARLKNEGKGKTATYRQLLGNKLQYQNIMAMYRLYGLLNEGAAKE